MTEQISVAPDGTTTPRLQPENERLQGEGGPVFPGPPSKWLLADELKRKPSRYAGCHAISYSHVSFVAGAKLAVYTRTQFTLAPALTVPSEDTEHPLTFCT